MTTTAKPGELFPCPRCGARDQWIAYYNIPAKQGVELRVYDDLTPIAQDYAGDEDHFDADADESYQCRACETEIDLDGTVITHDVEGRPE